MQHKNWEVVEDVSEEDLELFSVHHYDVRNVKEASKILKLTKEQIDTLVKRVVKEIPITRVVYIEEENAVKMMK